MVRTGTPSPDATTGESILATAPLLTTAEAAKRDGVTPKCIRERLKAGRLTGRKIGDRWLVEERGT